MLPEIARLDDCKLIAGETIDVYCAPADRIPAVLREIGRLREITFRNVGEGTGRDIDLDRFDDYYLHLFAWDRSASVVAGAYRVAPVDEIVGRMGVEGLYTSTLFRFDRQLLARLGPALELGRSFVRSEYQRSSNVLMLLWKGIARFVLQSDRYRVLFGPVSISARYGSRSRELLQTYLAQNARHELSELFRAITAPPRVEAAVKSPSDVQQLDAVISALEPDGKGVPVLLRQYLRLNAKLLAFNIDQSFSDVLDALMMVDLADVDRAILTRYFGREGAARVANRRSLSQAA
jgi:putative hemolysin